MADRTTHTLLRMGGRDPHEAGRSATPLELLFDLTFVIAFGAAADELAHAMAEGHTGTGVVGFLFATFAVSWAWINFAWFASAYDTDDWIYRLSTMVQMVGVLILALGLPDMFASLEHGEHVDNGVMVLGYAVMRLPMIAQWLRAAMQDPGRARVCRTMALTLVVAEVGWVLLVFADLAVVPMFGCVLVLVGIEMAGPALAERIDGGTPWHAHHIAERYGLLVIVTLGEGAIGTAAALAALVGPEGPGWSVDVAVLGLAGTGLTFGLWWTYFVLPFGDLLHGHRERSFGWGYGHIPLFGALVAVGAGLHVAAYFIAHHSDLTTTGTVVALAVPVAVYTVLLYAIYAQCTRTWDPFHSALIAGSAVTLLGPVVMAGAGVSLVWCLAVLALTPWVTVVGYEAVGHRHNEQLLAELT